MPEANEDQVILQLLRTGDQDAARKVFNSYVNRLVALARNRLSQKMQRRVDPEDIVQSVFRTFFVRAKEGQFTVEKEDDLSKLLYGITVRKTLRRIAFHKAEKRSTALEKNESEESYRNVMDVIGKEPTPEAEVAFVDELEHFMTKMPADYRPILEMRLQGYSSEEIAQKLGTYDRRIRRVVEHIRELLAAEQIGK
jgi:RNA polymerase sigma-70 factor (ECF subfamily)